MADKKSASQTTKSTKPAEKKMSPDGKHEFRPCTGYQKEHPAHTWHSHVANGVRWCDGERRDYADYSAICGFKSGSYSWAKKQTDYLTATDDNDRPFREDFDAPMTVREARAIAFHMHRDDTDKSGEPYILHLAAVEAGVKVLAGPDAVEERIAALFHDAVEDGHTTFKHLKEIGCSEYTVSLIEAVSKRSGEEQNKYLTRIIEAGPGAMRVKVADILHNTRHDRMEKVKKSKGQYTHDRLLKKYRPALARLMMELSLIVDEDEQKKIATKPIGTAGGYGWSSTAKSGSSSTGSTTNHGFGCMVKSMYVGDWPTVWDAPITDIHNGDGKSTFVLANGEVKADVPWKDNKGNDVKMHLYAFSSWSTSAAVNPSGHATEDEILEFMNAVEEAKEKGKKAGSLASSVAAAVAESDPADMTGFWDEETMDWAGL